jgi:hypothetical protein
MINIFDLIKDNKNYSPERSVAWFQKNVRQFATSVGAATPLNVLGANLDKQTRTIMPGQMIMFTYSAKHRDTLPYWDKFPLVLPFSASKTHFTGLNLHYLSPKMRAALLTKLMDNNNTIGRGDKARLNLNWQILNAAGKYPEIAPCIKQYIFGYVKSNFMTVPQADWPIAIHLPLERFEGQQSSSVWANSSRNTRKR